MSKSWAKFYVEDHSCGAFNLFYASSLRTAEAFRQHWGGTIKIA